jgi:hypothetical protein
VNAQPDITGLFANSALEKPRMDELTPFEFEGHTVHVTDRDGNPWWVLTDVCKPLGIANPRDAASRLGDDEKGVATTDTLGGPQQTTIVNESRSVLDRDRVWTDRSKAAGKGQRRRGAPNTSCDKWRRLMNYKRHSHASSCCYRGTHIPGWFL